MNGVFEDLIGQPLAVNLLASALTSQRLAPAYLFAGPDGVGRRLAALRFLEGMLAETGSSPRQRRRLEERNHPDLLWVEPTFQHQGRLLTRVEAEEAGIGRRTPPQLRLEQIRGVSRFLARQPVEAMRGMVVIETAEAMAESAANALLKTLEEPGHGLMILLSASPEQLLSTIRSLSADPVPASRCGGTGSGAARCDAVADDPPEILAMAAGSPGALLEHRRHWNALPDDFRQRLQTPPDQAMDALALARDLSDVLDGEQQLWLINWWQQRLWRQNGDSAALERLERLRPFSEELGRLPRRPYAEGVRRHVAAHTQRNAT